MMLSSGLFLLLLSGLQAGAQESDVQAMVGSTVRLGCVFPGGSSFNLSDLFVYWQIGDSNTVVVAYYLSGNSSADHVDSRYRSRAHLTEDGLRQGDFSLLLQDVSPRDAQAFRCLVFRKSLLLRQILEMEIRLHVAANFSVPVVSSPHSPTQDQELIFTCTSTNGYPRPNVYWINKTDNSVLAEALQNHTVSVNARGLYDVVSVLTLPLAAGVDVGCCIENELLSQNLTSHSQPAASTGAGLGFTTNPAGHRREDVLKVSVVLPVLVVVSAVVLGLGCFAGGWRCPRRSYPGVHKTSCKGEKAVEQELTDEAAQSFFQDTDPAPKCHPGDGGPGWRTDSDTLGSKGDNKLPAATPALK